MGNDSPVSLFEGVPHEDFPKNEKYSNEPLLKSQSLEKLKRIFTSFESVGLLGSKPFKPFRCKKVSNFEKFEYSNVLPRSLRPTTVGTPVVA